MVLEKQDIVSRLRKEILLLEGYRSQTLNAVNPLLPREIIQAFPNNQFPLGTMHEFACGTKENIAASASFLCSILQSSNNNSAVFWIGNHFIFPSALYPSGINTDNIIFITPRNAKENEWVLLEALSCKAVSFVIGELKDVSFTSCRKMQLAVEQSNVTGFILRTSDKYNTGTFTSRWRITHLPGSDIYGVGHPRWKIILEKIRNGKPGEWQVEYVEGKVAIVQQPVFESEIPLRKIG